MTEMETGGNRAMVSNLDMRFLTIGTKHHSCTCSTSTICSTLASAIKVTCIRDQSPVPTRTKLVRVHRPSSFFLLSGTARPHMKLLVAKADITIPVA